MKAQIRLANAQTWWNQQSNIVAIDINVVKSRMLQVRGQPVLLDRDFAADLRDCKCSAELWCNTIAYII